MRLIPRGRLTLSAAGPVPADVAWQRYEQYALWSTWSPYLQRVETGLDTLTVGATGRVLGPVGVSVDFTVLELDTARRRWTWRVSRGPVTLTLEHGVEQEDTGSRTWLVLNGPLPIIAPYAPIARYALHRLVTLPETSSDQGIPPRS